MPSRFRESLLLLRSSALQARCGGFSRALRRELRGTGVQVGVVLPYLGDTAMGAGLRAQLGFRAVTPAQVAARVMRALDSRSLIHFVPTSLRYASMVMNALPLWLRDLIDDALSTDRIGLGGDVHERERYTRQLPIDPPQDP